MLFALKVFVEFPFHDVDFLRRCVQTSCREERLAALMANSGLLSEVSPDVACQPEIDDVDMDTAANTLKALVGAYVGEEGGDFYSVAKLWQWLGSDELQFVARGEVYMWNGGLWICPEALGCYDVVDA